MDTASCWMCINQNVPDLGCLLTIVKKTAGRTATEREFVYRQRGMWFWADVFCRGRAAKALMWTGSGQLHRNTNFNHKSFLILGDRCGKVSSEKISIDLDVMTGSMDFREAFGLRPADVKAFIHSACQADTVDTSDAGGAGRAARASGRMGFMLTTFTMNSFKPNKPFHLTILFPDHLLYPPDLFSICLITNLFLLPHSFIHSPPQSFSHDFTFHLIYSLYTLSRRFHPTLFIISCGGVSMILSSIISLVSRSFCRTYPQHAFSIYLIIFLSHHLIHCFTSSVFSLAYLIRCFASIIVLPHALYMYDCMIWKCLHLSFCSRCCKRIYIHTEFVRYTDILIQTRAYIYIYAQTGTFADPTVRCFKACFDLCTFVRFFFGCFKKIFLLATQNQANPGHQGEKRWMGSQHRLHYMFGHV